MTNPYTHTCAGSPEPCLGCEWDEGEREWDAIDAALHPNTLEALAQTLEEAATRTPQP